MRRDQSCVMLRSRDTAIIPVCSASSRCRPGRVHRLGLLERMRRLRAKWKIPTETTSRGRPRQALTAAGSREEMADQRQTAGNREEQNLFPERATFVAAFPLLLFARFMLHGEHHTKFCEIDTAFLTRSAVPLDVPAGSTRKPKWLVTSNAEARRNGIVETAAQTCHTLILAGCAVDSATVA